MNMAHTHTWLLVALGRYRDVWRCACGHTKEVFWPDERGLLSWTTQR
jgi:hypothetical protein